jgi:hypothetical protein
MLLPTCHIFHTQQQWVLHFIHGFSIFCKALTMLTIPPTNLFKKACCSLLPSPCYSRVWNHMLLHLESNLLNDNVIGTTLHSTLPMQTLILVTPLSFGCLALHIWAPHYYALLAMINFFVPYVFIWLLIIIYVNVKFN